MISIYHCVSDEELPLQELYNKYPKGKAVIADVASNKTVNGVKGANHDLFSKIGQTIDGDMILEIPVQTKPIPTSVLNEARDLGIKIRDIQGEIY